MSRATAVAFACMVVLAGVPDGVLAQQSPNDGPRGWLGVLLGDAPARPASADGAEAPAGVRIARVVLDGPAARAGFRAGDVVLEVDGEIVRSNADLVERIGSLEPGSWIAIRLDRRGTERELRVRLDVRPERPGGLRMRDGWIGVEAIDLPPGLRVHFGADEDAGVMISSVEEGGAGFVAGFELGDVVFAVDGVPVRSSAQLASLIAGGGVGNVLEFSLMRSGVEIVLEAEISEPPPPELRPRGDSADPDRS